MLSGHNTESLTADFEKKKSRRIADATKDQFSIYFQWQSKVVVLIVPFVPHIGDLGIIRNIAEILLDRWTLSLNENV